MTRYVTGHRVRPTMARPDCQQHLGAAWSSGSGHMGLGSREVTTMFQAFEAQAPGRQRKLPRPGV
jgi:hypothetical protein